MKDFSPIYTVLDNCLTLYTNMLDFENAKYTVIVEKDVIQLEDMLKVEQAFIMKSSVLEKQRAAVQSDFGYDDYTLLELANSLGDDDCKRLLEYREKLLLLLTSIKKTNAKSMQLAEARLRATERQLEKSGYLQDMHTYDGAGAATENSAGINKILITKSV